MLAFLLSLTDESNHNKVLYLYEKYYGEALRIARCKLSCMPNPEIDAQDATQEAFSKITTHIDYVDFELEDSKIRSYVMEVVRNEAINIIRQRKNQTHVSLDEIENLMASDEDIAGEAAERDELKCITESIDELKEKYRITVHLRYIIGLSPKQIAATLEIPERPYIPDLNEAWRSLKRITKGD